MLNVMSVDGSYEIGSNIWICSSYIYVFIYSLINIYEVIIMCIIGLDFEIIIEI